ncbi:ABC transporter permease subunit, partial [Pseudomonas syringae group genomosp. 7]|uniref:ABC transporter permease subunit n=1 Tax=Pseudomonas syringae group genomosp. 7 TaxID=251699 RepID=UPI00376F86CD
NKRRRGDNLIRVFTTTGLGKPAYRLGIMLILIFIVQLGWFPVSVYGIDWLDNAHHMVVPCLTIALAVWGVLILNVSASMLME